MCTTRHTGLIQPLGRGQRASGWQTRTRPSLPTCRHPPHPGHLRSPRGDHPSLADASEPSTAGQYMQSALPLFSRQCYGLQKRVCRFRTPAPRPRSSLRSRPLRFVTDIAPALQSLPVRLLVCCTNTLRGVPNRRRNLKGGSSSSYFRGCFLLNPAAFVHTWFSVWHAGGSPYVRQSAQPSANTPDPTSSRSVTS